MISQILFLCIIFSPQISSASKPGGKSSTALPKAPDLHSLLPAAAQPKMEPPILTKLKGTGRLISPGCLGRINEFVSLGAEIKKQSSEMIRAIGQDTSHKEALTFVHNIIMQTPGQIVYKAITAKTVEQQKTILKKHTVSCLKKDSVLSNKYCAQYESINETYLRLATQSGFKKSMEQIDSSVESLLESADDKTRADFITIVSESKTLQELLDQCA